MRAVIVTILNKLGFKELMEERIQTGFRQYKYIYTSNNIKFTVEGTLLVMNRNNNKEKVIRDITTHTTQELIVSIREFTS